MATASPPGVAPRTKILVAVAPQTVERMRSVLEGHALTFVDSVDEGIAVLQRQKFGMVILGVHFDESQMFTLLSHIRTDARYRVVPVVVVLGTRGPLLTDVAIEGLDHAVKAMMANAFLDLHKFPEDETGNDRIRRIIDYLILIDGDLHQGLS
jgi:PleD family two-component response regulator